MEKKEAFNLAMNSKLKKDTELILENIDTTQMTEDKIHEKILKGYDSYKEGRIFDAKEEFDNFRKNHNKEKSLS